MSSPQNTTANTAVDPTDDKKKGIEKYVAKFKKALGRANSTVGGSGASKRQSVAGPSSAANTSKATTDSKTKTTDTAKEKTELLKKAGVDTGKISIDLGAPAERVEKKIRLRVHRTCHECKSEFGKERICPKCSHKRCKDCTRSPPKKRKGEKKATTAAAGTGAAETSSKNKNLITKPSRTGGQDLVMRKPVQRVRRYCHACDTLFQPGSKECQKCQHIRCTDCPRNPAKAKKYPYGYPGDAPGEDESRIFKECHECQTVFSKGETTCRKCGHQQCEQCPRTAPRKILDYHDPDVVRSVEEKLARLGLGGPPTQA